MRPFLYALATVALVVVAYVAGTMSPHGPLMPFRTDADGASRMGFSDTDGRTKVDCATLTEPNTAVLFTLGQSNAGNYGQSADVPAQHVFNFNPADGACYTASEPLLGATGDMSSPWTRLGNRLVAASLYDTVIIVPIAIGDSSITEWAWGDGHMRMVSAVRGVLTAGLSITHVLWHQGETDAIDAMTSKPYQQHLAIVLKSLRALGVAAPIYIAQASLCKDTPRNDAIRQGQRAIIDQFEGVTIGADTDTLTGPDMRYDGCHFTARGLDAHAGLWFDALARTNDK